MSTVEGAAGRLAASCLGLISLPSVSCFLWYSGLFSSQVYCIPTAQVLILVSPKKFFPLWQFIHIYCDSIHPPHCSGNPSTWPPPTIVPHVSSLGFVFLSFLFCCCVAHCVHYCYLLEYRLVFLAWACVSSHSYRECMRTAFHSTLLSVFPLLCSFCPFLCSLGSVGRYAGPTHSQYFYYLWDSTGFIAHCKRYFSGQGWKQHWSRL